MPHRKDGSWISLEDWYHQMGWTIGRFQFVLHARFPRWKFRRFNVFEVEQTDDYDWSLSLGTLEIRHYMVGRRNRD